MIDRIAILVFVLLILTSISERYYIKSLGTDVKIYKEMLENLQKQSEYEFRKFNEAKKLAALQIEEIKKQSQVILNTKVSSNCERAMQWGLNEASTFN